VIAKKLLSAAHNINIVGFVDKIGEIEADISNLGEITLEQVEANIVRCPDQEAATKMIALIERMRRQKDSMGGSARIIATGVPAGLGEPVFDKLKADLGKAIFTLPAVMGVEYGSGFEVTKARGSENNDTFIKEGAVIKT